MALGELFGAAPQVDPTMGMQAPQTQAPLSAEEHEERKKGWKGVLQKMSDPNVQAAMLQTGLGLMRSTRPGESGWDIASQSLGAGVSTLQMLREADRVKKLQEQDRLQRLRQQNTENNFKSRQVATGEQNAQVYKAATEGQTASMVKDDARGDRALTETERSNRAREETDRLRAQADLKRANAYTSSARTPGDIQKINALAAQMMLPAEQGGRGLDEVNARAEATKLVELQRASKSPSEMVQERYKLKLQTYMNSFEGMKNPVTKEMNQKFIDDSFNEVHQAIELDSQARGTGKLVNETANAPMVAGRQPGGIPATSTQDPTTLRKVEQLESRGVPPQAIQQALIAEGKDPKAYGY